MAFVFYYLFIVVVVYVFFFLLNTLNESAVFSSYIAAFLTEPSECRFLFTLDVIIDHEMSLERKKINKF